MIKMNWVNDNSTIEDVVVEDGNLILLINGPGSDEFNTNVEMTFDQARELAAKLLSLTGEGPHDSRSLRRADR